MQKWTIFPLISQENYEMIRLEMRVNMITDIEELSMNAWPALQTKLYDGWVLRFADGYTLRANSINPIYTSTISLDEKLKFCEKEYERINLPIVYKLTSDSQPKNIDIELEKRGYRRTKAVSLKTLQLDNYYEKEAGDVHITTQFRDDWFTGFFECSDLTNVKDQMTVKKMLNNSIGEVICVSKLVDNKVIGCGLGVVERDYIGIFDIVVDKGHRENGYGKNIMQSILNTAAKKDIKTAYLQVAVGNIAAERLYENLGFQEKYKYWYRVKEL